MRSVVGVEEYGCDICIFDGGGIVVGGGLLLRVIELIIDDWGGDILEILIWLARLFIAVL